MLLPVRSRLAHAIPMFPHMSTYAAVTSEVESAAMNQEFKKITIQHWCNCSI